MSLNLFSQILDCFFPPVCLGCNRLGHIICSQCLNSFEKKHGDICPTCLDKSVFGLRHDICQQTGSIDGLLSFWRFDERLRVIIQNIKYQSYWSGVEILMDYFLKQDVFELNLAFSKFLQTKPILVPIPIHWQRKNERGFNQATLIAKSLAKKWQLEVKENLVLRNRYTKPQASFSKEKRAKNIASAFSVHFKVVNPNGKPLSDKNILLIDDVWTTGNTMQQCAGVLKSLGAPKIWGLTLAR